MVSSVGKDCVSRRFTRLGTVVRFKLSCPRDGAGLILVGQVVRRIILQNSLCPGDVLMLTAAVRDLHLSCPGEFETDVRTPYPELWENNPYLVVIGDDEPGVERLECHYPLIKLSNHAPYHFIHGFRLFLSERLGVEITPHAFHGDIHLSQPEKEWFSQVDEITGAPDTRFWIIVAGGKTDYTAKWWDPARYQAVVDHFAGKLTFVQCGEASAGHVHEPLKGVINLVGKTDLRQLVRLTHHADGVVCPVTLMMHLAAAVETRPSRPKNRPCVVIAGGREPAQWEAYPHHQYLHTNGCLPCCDDGGCWKSRVEPLGDGEYHDRKLCVLPVKLPSGRALPKCLDLVTAEQVIQSIERYLAFDACYRQEAILPPTQVRGDARLEPPLNLVTARARMDAAMRDRPEYPGGFAGRGIVIPGGGNYFGCAWVCINRLRDLGCKLPIELWHLGPGEMTDRMRSLVAPLDVVCMDALKVREKHPVRLLKGWGLKPYSLLHCRFREALLLDADNVPVVNPTFLFGTPEYRERGSVFWPDYTRLPAAKEIWGLTGVEYRDEPEFESGQIVIDKQRCWKPLSLAMWMNEHCDFWYRFIHGDKDTFHFAWRKLGVEYAMPSRPIEPLYIPGRRDGAMCQHDFEGRRLFQHRNFGKWTINGERGDNPGFLDQTEDVRIPGFVQEDECRGHIERLRGFWIGTRIVSAEEREIGRQLCRNTWIYRRGGRESRQMTFGFDGRVIVGAAGCERTWEFQSADDKLCLAILGKDGLTCRLAADGPNRWRGRWVIHERMEVELTAVEAADAATAPPG
jgi:ADP-heptose:LPS heptosyltransferase